jgi:hypothetical protein
MDRTAKQTNKHYPAMLPDPAQNDRQIRLNLTVESGSK